MIYCPKCNAELSEGHQFCPNCGFHLPKSIPQVQPPAPQSFPQQPAHPNFPPPPYPPNPQTANRQSPPPFPPPPPAWQSQQYPTPTPKKKSNLGLIIPLIILVLGLTAGLIYLLLRNKNIQGQSDLLAQTATAEQLQRSVEDIVNENRKATEQAQLQSSSNDTNLAAEQTATHIANSMALAETNTAGMQETQTFQENLSAQQTQEAFNAQQTAIAFDEAEASRLAELIPGQERWRLDGATEIDTESYQEQIYENDDWLETIYIAEDLKNFMLTITFVNPESPLHTENWDLGILFRSKAANDQLRLFVTTPDYWELSYVGGEGSYWSTVRGWTSTIRALDLSGGGTNTITLIAYGDNGVFYVNGTLIGELDLRSRPHSGAVKAWMDYNSQRRHGEKTIFTDIHIWNLD